MARISAIRFLRVMPPVFSKRRSGVSPMPLRFANSLAEIAAPRGSIRQCCNRFANAAADRLLDKPQGARVLDVLFHLPQATVDRRARPKIRDAIPGTIVTIEAKVTEHHGPPNSRSRAPFKVLVEDDTGDVELVFFLANHEWVRSRLPRSASAHASRGARAFPRHRS